MLVLGLGLKVVLPLLHFASNYMKLKYLIQDLIDDKKVGVDGLMNNIDHKVSNEPRYPSMNKKKILGRKIGCKDQLHMIEPTFENINMIRSKGKKEGYKSNIILILNHL